MAFLFNITGFVALGMFLLMVWVVWLRCAWGLGDNLLSEYGQALSKEHGPMAQKIAALWFFLSGVALCIMLLSFVFVRDEDFSSSPSAIGKLVLVGWLGILGMATFLVSWFNWCRMRRHRTNGGSH